MVGAHIAVLVSGGGTNLQALLDAFNGSGSPHRVVLTVSNRKDAYGLVRAQEAGVEARYIGKGNFPDSAERSKELLKALQEAKADWVVLAGYLDILSPEIVETYNRRILNIHPSLIPAFCGMGFHGIHVHEAALARGVKFSGATVHFVDSGADTGPILLQEVVTVEQGDTPDLLQKRILPVEYRLLVQAVTAAADGRIVWSDDKPSIQDLDTGLRFA